MYHDAMQAKFEQLGSSNKEFKVCEGVDHFWFGHESQVAAAVTDWLQRTVPTISAAQQASSR